MTDKILYIGEITGTHGIKGELKIKPLTDDPKRFSFFKDGYLIDPRKKTSAEVFCQSVKYFKNTVILKLEGVDNLEGAILLKGKLLGVTREHAIPLPEKTYFICDLEGIHVIDTEGESLGILKEVLFTGAHDVYIVQRPHQKDLLIPAIRSVVEEIDLHQRIMRVRLPEGLKEIYENTPGGLTK
jgi:16S rRNA processing protein RimM